ncbi:hypothetical protein D3C73_1050630 [compost metagenome]
MDRRREHLGNRAGQRDAREARAVEPGDRPDHRQCDGANRAVKRHMLRQRDAQVVHDAVRAVRQRIAEQLGEGRVAQVKEGGNRNHRAEHLEAEHKAFNQVGGNPLQPLVMVREKGDHNQDQHRRSADQCRSVASLQIEREHRRHIQQE